VVWPLHYLAKGMTKAVAGCWDPSTRKFYKTDELSYTHSFQMISDILSRFEDSILKTDSWATVQKKIQRSKRTWGEN
jgi:hypothetical protein